MKVARRVLSTFLSVLLVVTALPFTVMAGETDLDPFSYPLPTATVTEVTPAETDVVLFDFATKQPTDLKADLGAEYVFTPDAVSAEAMEYYKDWIGDFVVTADAALAAGSFGLYGAYGGNALAFVWPNDVAAGDSIFLLQTAGFDNHLTYQEIVTVVQAFTCGAFNLSDTNADTLHHLSVKFVLWAPGTDPATSPEAVKTVAEKEYDFADVTSVQYPLPTGTASEVTPAATDLPIYIVPAMTNTLRRTDLAAEYALAADA
ncbi:MAG: hypothetical protein IK088_03190, partial [Lachnospiraceae bacterium]|nr:hypothetical protein [Lachnospiraceae bacterium]MBR4767961.1 hypothetical protein [Lachnospiraceae bacterium]